MNSDTNDGLAASPLTGLARVANNEHECRFSTVDLDGSPPEASAEYLFDEAVLPPDAEFEIAYRAGVRHALRLQRVEPRATVARTFNAVADDGTFAPFQLQINSPGILANLALHETQRHAHIAQRSGSARARGWDQFSRRDEGAWHASWQSSRPAVARRRFLGDHRARRCVCD